ncbi:MAG: redox-regulated ATPase YchF [Desulfobacteraceae bacterium 4572_19]|nr:MAG: redox-regulated ATPase YchF [Desulfobacteraceae bacterium 4572_19]
MKVGIIGLPQTGKNTLFQVLTSIERKEHTTPSKAIQGIAEILDARFDILVDTYVPKKTVRAKVDLVLLPKMEQEAIARGDIFRDFADMDAICHIVRAFEDEAVYHVDGSVNPMRDIDMVNSELILHDLLFIEKRIERIENTLKKIKDEVQQKELILLIKMKEHLEGEKPLRLMAFSEDEEAFIKSYPFITKKQMVLVLNIAEDKIQNNKLMQDLKERCDLDLMKVMQISAQVESEIVMLDTDEEKEEFLSELGIKEPALSTLARLCLEALGLVSFFTVGTDEVRQWLVKTGSSAPEAAGVIHSDLQRGFIRAEVMKYDELMEHGNEAELKKAGKIYLHGKDYIVDDGDILNIRFKV